MNDFAKAEYKGALFSCAVINDAEDKTRFEIDSLEKASWAFRRIRACNEKVAEVVACANNERAVIDLWEKEETEKARASIETFKAMLADYYYKEKEKDPKFKLSTPYGKGYAKSNAPELIYPDDVTERFEALGLKEFVRVKKEVDKKAVRASVTVTEDNRVVTSEGEVLEFIKAEPKEPTFIITGIQQDRGDSSTAETEGTVPETEGTVRDQ